MAYYKPQSPIKNGEDYIYPLTTVDQVMLDDGSRLNAKFVTINVSDEETGTVPYTNADQLGGKPASEYALKEDVIFSINGIEPDENGNVQYNAPVASVNGKTGVVQLTASDVGARPSDWMPTASDVGALSASGMAADAAKLGGKAPQYYIQPRNLLDNSDFRNPVNQRGLTTYNTEGYTIDRWRIWDGSSVVVNNGSITVEGNLLQYITGLPVGKTLTFAIGNTEETRIGTVGYDTVPGYYYVNIPAGTWTWCAVYEGSYTIDTLPPYVPKGYGVELAECLRYFERKFFKTVTISQTNMYMAVDYVEKRIVPSITGVITDSFNITNPTIGLWNIEKNIVNGIFGSLTTQTAQAHCYGYFDISADL